MTNLDAKHLDALVADFRNGRICAENGAKCCTMDEPSGCYCAMAADAITALRAQIDRERAATIEAAAEASDCGCGKDRSDCMAKKGFVSYCYRDGATDIRALHTDATRAAMDAIRREGYEAGVREEMAKLADLANAARDLADCCQLGDDADWAEGEDPLSVLRERLAASTSPDPDANADSRQQAAPKATEAECPQPEKWRAGECCGGCLGSSKPHPPEPVPNDTAWLQSLRFRRLGYRAGIRDAARWLETVPQSLPNRQEYAEQVRALAEKGEWE